MYICMPQLLSLLFLSLLCCWSWWCCWCDRVFRRKKLLWSSYELGVL